MEWNELIIELVFMAVIAFLTTLTGSKIYTQKMNWWQRQLVRVVRVVVAHIYETQVREMKQQHPDGKLTVKERELARTSAKREIRREFDKFLQEKPWLNAPGIAAPKHLLEDKHLDTHIEAAVVAAKKGDPV